MTLHMLLNISGHVFSLIKWSYEELFYGPQNIVRTVYEASGKRKKKVFVIERQLCVEISYIHQSPVFLPF